MPYREHYVFEEPDDVNQKIWRYMDFRKYVDLLDKQVLFFARLDILEDKFEGSITRPEMELRRQWRKQWVDMFRSFFPELTLDKIMAEDSKFWENFRKYIFVNCWHMNGHESDAMWKLYSKDKKSIAIQSTYKKLQKSLDEHKENDVFIGKVEYIDITKDMSPPDNFLRKYIRKEKSFEHEQELRAVIFKLTDDKGNLLKKPFDAGIFVSVNLDLLIDRVVVSPSANYSFLDKVRSITKKHNIDKKVELSILATKPLF